MDATVSPLNMLLQFPAAGVPVSGNAGVAPGADLFAALLAGQLGQQMPELMQEVLPLATVPGRTGAPDLAAVLAGPALPGDAVGQEAPEVDVDGALSEGAMPQDAAFAALAIASPVIAPPVQMMPSSAELPAMTGRAAAIVPEEVGAAQRQPLAVAPAAFAAQEVMSRQSDGGEFSKFVAQQDGESMSVPTSLAQASITGPIVTQGQALPTQGGAQVTSGVPVVVGHSAWGEAVGERVVWMVSQQYQNVELHLNPPALGPLEVRLNIADGQASLSFSTQHLPVKEAIESATPRLREMLGESGVSLGSVSVNVGTFAQHRQEQPYAQSAAGRENPVAGFSSLEGSSIPAAVTRLTGARGMVDLFA